MKLVKVIAAFTVAVIVSACNCVSSVSAANDVGASVYGFNVDNSQYKSTRWYNTVTTNVKSDGHIIGVCTTTIGNTRANKSVSGQYIDQIFVKCTMKGRNPKSGKAGYSEHLTIKSTLPSGTSLAAYSPESQAGMKSYQIGANAGASKSGVSAGISGSTTVTKKALTINNYCDTAARLVEICYDYKNNWNIFSGYETYGKYSYNESIQRMNYAIKTGKSKYKTSIVVIPKFEEMDGTGYWTFTKKKWYSVNQTITFTTSY